jgi:hypothetical protein
MQSRLAQRFPQRCFLATVNSIDSCRTGTDAPPNSWLAHSGPFVIRTSEEPDEVVSLRPLVVRVAFLRLDNRSLVSARVRPDGMWRVTSPGSRERKGSARFHRLPLGRFGLREFADQRLGDLVREIAKGAEVRAGHPWPTRLELSEGFAVVRRGPRIGHDAQLDERRRQALCGPIAALVFGELSIPGFKRISAPTGNFSVMPQAWSTSCRADRRICCIPWDVRAVLGYDAAVRECRERVCQ